MECKGCHEKVGTPQPACTLKIVIPASAISGFLCALLTPWAHDAILHSRSDAIGGEGLIFAIPFFALFSWVFWQVPRSRMRWRFRRVTCPHCGASNWAQPRYSGFRVWA
jgi:hypothetical protein